VPFPFFVLAIFFAVSGNMYNKHLGLYPHGCYDRRFAVPPLEPASSRATPSAYAAYASFTGASKGFVLDLHEIVDISEDGASLQCPSALELNRKYDCALTWPRAAERFIQPPR